MLSAQMQLSIITVNYKSEKYLKKCIESISGNLSGKITFEVVIVNNDQETSLPALQESFDIKIINNENEGFGRGSNLGAANARGKYLFFLNPDSKLENDSLLSLIEKMEKREDIGIIGPKIIEFSKKRPQPWTCGKKVNLLSILFRNTINKPWNKKFPSDVDWVSGTALLIKKDLFNKLNGFDNNIFMYFEDQDLCLRAKELGKKIVFDPNSHIIHFDGKSWNENSQKKDAFYKSQTYFFKKHNGPFQTTALCFLRKITKGG